MTKTYFLTLTHENDGYMMWRIRPYDDDFKELQKEVGGTFAHFNIFPPYNSSSQLIHGIMRIDSWINDEGKLIGLPPTIPLADESGEIVDLIVGNICFLKSDDMGNSYGLDMDDINQVIKSFKEVYVDRYLVPVRNPDRVYWWND